MDHKESAKKKERLARGLLFLCLALALLAVTVQPMFWLMVAVLIMVIAYLASPTVIEYALQRLKDLLCH